MADKDGNMVSLIQSNYRGMGSGMTPGELGFILQDRGELFALEEGHANVYEPGKRPFHTIIPAFAFKDGKPWIATGSPGGSRIITTVLQIIVNLVDHGMSPADAVAAPRFHHQWLPDRLFLEAGFSPDTVSLLRNLGHDVDERRRTMGSAQTVVWDGTWFRGAADPRRPDADEIGTSQLDFREDEVACAH